MPIGLLAFASFAIWMLLMLIAGLSWKAISVSNPDYAKDLFTPGVDQAIYRLGPLRWRILFSRRAPVGIRGWVITLRAMIVIQFCTATAFVLSLVCLSLPE